MLKFVKLSIFLGLFLVFAGTALAQSNNANSNANRANQPASSVNSAQNVKDRAATGAAMRKNNLSEARLRICEARQERINNRLSNLVTLGASSIDSFDIFVQRVDNYYLDKLAPSGYTIANYDELMGEIAGNKDEVIAALAEAKANGQQFSCNSEDPKGQTDSFRAAIQDLIQARRDYKSSVREFVAEVRDLAKEARSARLSVTPEATPSAAAVQTTDEEVEVVE